MPRKPKATSPNANTATAVAAEAVSSCATPASDTQYATAISPAMSSPSQKALKLPAVSPERTLSDAPPSRLAVTISLTWRDDVEVKILVNSGISAPAAVPQEMIV